MRPATIQLLNPRTLPSPPGYSQIAHVTGGELIVIAGQVALDQHGRVVGEGDFEAQTVQVFRNLLAALEAVDATAVNLVKLTTYVTDLSELATFRKVRDRFLHPAYPPTSTLVQVAGLFRPEFLIEVEALAAR